MGEVHELLSPVPLDEEAGHFMKEEEDHMKLQKQEALQLLKKKEKTENILKVFSFTSFRF